jgi:hypothetical protein
LAWRSEDPCATASTREMKACWTRRAVRVVIKPASRSFAWRILVRGRPRITNAGRATYVEWAGTYRPRHATPNLPACPNEQAVRSRRRGARCGRLTAERCYYLTFKNGQRFKTLTVARFLLGNQAKDAKMRLSQRFAPNCHMLTLSHGMCGNILIAFLPTVHALAAFFVNKRFEKLAFSLLPHV